MWKFDDELNTRMKVTGDITQDLQSVTCKIALIYGQNSASFSVKSAAHMKELQPTLEVFELADAQHHLFLDQPVSFMRQLSSILVAWS